MCLAFNRTWKQHGSAVASCCHGFFVEKTVVLCIDFYCQIRTLYMDFLRGVIFLNDATHWAKEQLSNPCIHHFQFSRAGVHGVPKSGIWLNSTSGPPKSLYKLLLIRCCCSDACKHRVANVVLVLTFGAASTVLLLTFVLTCADVLGLHWGHCFRTFWYLCSRISVYWSNGHGWPQRPLKSSNNNNLPAFQLIVLARYLLGVPTP